MFSVVSLFGLIFFNREMADGGVIKYSVCSELPVVQSVMEDIYMQVVSTFSAVFLAIGENALM